MGKAIKSSNIKDFPHEFRDINFTNAVIIRNVRVEDRLCGHEPCHLNFNYILQAVVFPVMHIQVYFT